jgi:hypothetical protein
MGSFLRQPNDDHQKTLRASITTHEQLAAYQSIVSAVLPVPTSAVNRKLRPESIEEHRNKPKHELNQTWLSGPEHAVRRVLRGHAIGPAIHIYAPREERPKDQGTFRVDIGQDEDGGIQENQARLTVHRGV